MMPYINADRRKVLDAGVGYTPGTVGELNYVITRHLVQWVEQFGLDYTTINAAIGALESAKLEFYRRVAVPYEDEKIVVNGDVYPQESDPPDSKNTPAQFPTGPHFCHEVMVGWGDDPRPFVCRLRAGHAGQHTYMRMPPNA